MFLIEREILRDCCAINWNYFLVLRAYFLETKNCVSKGCFSGLQKVRSQCKKNNFDSLHFSRGMHKQNRDYPKIITNNISMTLNWYLNSTLAAISILLEDFHSFLSALSSDRYIIFFMPFCMINFAHSLHGNKVLYNVQSLRSFEFLLTIALSSAWHTAMQIFFQLLKYLVAEYPVIISHFIWKETERMIDIYYYRNSIFLLYRLSSLSCPKGIRCRYIH